MKMVRGVGLAVLISLEIALSAGSSVAAAAPDFLPTPKSVALEEGTMPLTAKSRIVATDSSLAPLART